jgi:peptide-methionine (S)-S-oxide reductase
VEAAFRKTHGVTSTIVGYTGGHTDRPTYREISLGNTGHAEAVLVTYDPTQVSYAELLDVFWNCHDPTVDRAGGPHASVIFVHDARQEATARASLDEVARSNWFKGAITTQIVTAGPFYPAEAYHQQYLAAHGDLEACHTGSAVIRTLLAGRAAAARSAAGAQLGAGPE